MNDHMELTYQDYDEGRRFFIPVTLREIEGADIQLNSAIGINASEHGESSPRAWG